MNLYKKSLLHVLHIHCTYTALLEKSNVRGTPLIERFLLWLLNSSSIRLLENVPLIKSSLRGAPRMLYFSNRAVYVQWHFWSQSCIWVKLFKLSLPLVRIVEQNSKQLLKYFTYLIYSVALFLNEIIYIKHSKQVRLQIIWHCTYFNGSYNLMLKL